LVQDEEDWIANLANTCALLKEAFNWWWVGFYLVKNQELVLGPFQGPIACTRIAKGKGVCGTAWQQQKTIIVPNVHEFPGHIACSSASLSEIVLPIFGSNQEVIGVLDVDSEFLACFDEIDARYLEEVLRILSQSN
jgi:GAF domain-containing protein